MIREIESPLKKKNNKRTTIDISECKKREKSSITVLIKGGWSGYCFAKLLYK